MAAVTVRANSPVVPSLRGAPNVVQSAEERNTAVMDFLTFRLRVRRAMYGTTEVHNMWWTAKNMKHAFGAKSYSTWKTSRKCFSSLRKFVNTCNRNGVTEV